MIRAAIAFLLLASASVADAQTFAIVNGTVALGDGSAPIPNGCPISSAITSPSESEPAPAPAAPSGWTSSTIP